MTELWSEPATQSHLQKRLTPTVALVKKGRVQGLRETLLQRRMAARVGCKLNQTEN
jgi:hypothetical protein